MPQAANIPRASLLGRELGGGGGGVWGEWQVWGRKKGRRDGEGGRKGEGTGEGNGVLVARRVQPM